MSRSTIVLLVILAIIASLGWANYAIVNEKCSRLKSEIEELRSAYVELRGKYDGLQKQFGKEEVSKVVEPSTALTVNWSLIWEKRMQHAIDYLAISPNGKYVVATSGSKIFVLSENGSILWNLDMLDHLLSHDVVPLLISDDGEVWVIDIDGWRLAVVKSGEVILKSEFYGNITFSVVKDIEVSKNGKYIVAGPAGGPVYFYGRNNSKLIKLWEWAPIVDVEDVALSDNGTYIAIGNLDNWITLLKSDGTLLWERKIPYAHIGFIPDSSLMYVIQITDSKTGLISKVGILDTNGRWVIEPFQIDVLASTWKYDHGISVSRDFIFIPEDLAYSNKVYVYDLKEGNLVSIIEVREEVRDLAATPDGEYIVIGDGALRIYLFKMEK